MICNGTGTEHDHGAVLARDLGYTPLYLHYNSGLHTSTNGRALSGLLEALLEQWPHRVEELVIIAHSMGGLVARSACHYAAAAGHDWLRRLRKLAFLGTPHHGAPLERGGNWVDVILGAAPYAAPFARLGKIRSAGITDLRYGNVLDEHWKGRDRFARARDTRQSVPLPDGVQSYAMAATTGKKPGDIRDRLLGDGLVPVSSALGLHEDPHRSLRFPKSRQWIGYGMNHMDLLGRDRSVRSNRAMVCICARCRRPTSRSTRTRAKARPSVDVTFGVARTRLTMATDSRATLGVGGVSAGCFPCTVRALGFIVTPHDAQPVDAPDPLQRASPAFAGR